MDNNDIHVPEQVKAAALVADGLIAEQAAARNGVQAAPAEVYPSKPQNQDLPPKENAETIESLTLKLKESDHKFSVLQGKYDKEIKALGDDPNILNTLKAEIGTLRRQNNDFSKIISDQQNKLAAISAKEPVEPAKPVELTAEELEHLAAEGIQDKTLDILRKLAPQTAQPEIAEIIKKVDAMQGSVAAVQKTEAEIKNDKFFGKLTQEVPNWRQINGSDEAPNDAWVAWLDVKAPYQDKTRNEVLKAAQDRFDIGTCIQLFKDFIAESGTKPADPPPTDPPPGETKVDETLKIDPNKLVEPASTTSTELPKDGPTYTMDEYKEHYAALTKGHWKGREKEWEEKSKLLDKAFADGRIK